MSDEMPAPPVSSPAPVPAATPARGRGMGRATALLSAATFLSRILGLVREQAFAALLGAGFYGDAFTIAFRLPNLLRDLFAEGALSAGFQPTFMQRLRQAGPKEAYRLANLVQTTLLVVVGALVILGIVFAPALVARWGRGFSAIPGKSELTVALTRIMMPFLLLVSLASVVMAMLNAEERYFFPAVAPALFNVAAICGGALLWLFGARHSRTAALGWAVATLCGGLLQFLIQVPALWRSGYRFVPRLDPRFRDPWLRQILSMMAPASVGLMATQVNVYISSEFASSENGAATWLYFAFRLLQLPIGMFGVAVGTVALTRFARSGAELAAPKDDPRPERSAEQLTEFAAALQEVRDTLRRGLRMVSFLTVPTAVGLFLLAEPIIAVIYQHGAFHREDTVATAAALRYYTVGLWAYAAVKVVAPVFYALRLPRIPVTASVLAVAANVALNVMLHPHYGFRVLALGTSVAALVNLGYLLARFQARHGGLWQGDLVLALCRIGMAAVFMGGVVYGLDRGFWLTWSWAAGAGLRHGTLATLLDLALVIPAGGVAYGGLCWLMGLEEVKAVADRLGGRLRRRR